MKRTLITIALLAVSPPALAERLSLGSMELRACSKGESAKVRPGRQRATLFLEISAPNFPRVQDELRQCAEYSVAAATLPALLKNLSGAQSAFWAEFAVCSRYTEWQNANLSVEESCHY